MSVSSSSSEFCTHGCGYGSDCETYEQGEEKRTLVVVIAKLSVSKIANGVEKPRKTLDLGRADVPDDRLGCDDLRRTFLITS